MIFINSSLPTVIGAIGQLKEGNTFKSCGIVYLFRRCDQNSKLFSNFAEYLQRAQPMVPLFTITSCGCSRATTAVRGNGDILEFSVTVLAWGWERRKRRENDE